MGPLVIQAASWSHVLVAAGAVVSAIPVLLLIIVALDRRVQ